MVVLSTNKLFGDKKIAICSLRESSSACLQQIAQQIMLLLVNYVQEKCMAECLDKSNFGSACTTCNLHVCYSFALVLHGKCWIFYSDMHNFSCILFDLEFQTLCISSDL